MDLLFAAASGGTSGPLSTGLSLMRRYSLTAASKADFLRPEGDPHVSLAAEPKAEPQVSPVAEPEVEAQVSPVADADEEAATDVVRIASQHELGSRNKNEAPNFQGVPNDTQESTSHLPSTSQQATVVACSSVSADDVVGIRHPRNDRRRTLGSARGKCSEVYLQLCRLYEVKTNSRVLRILQQHEENSQCLSNPFDDLTSLDLSLCMLRDKGLLPVVEMLRFCINLRYLSLASNDITNEGIEFLAHAVVEGTIGSSFEVPNSDDDPSPSCSEAAREKQIHDRIEMANVGPMVSTRNEFGAHMTTLDVSDNIISLGGLRLLQLVAEKLPSLLEVNVAGAHVDRSEIDELQAILAENRSWCG